MQGINLGRVILGGLVAGLIINAGEFVLNTYVAGEATAQALAARNLMMPDDVTTMALWAIYGFVYGIALIYVYAAIRPRFGAGVATAIYAGLMVWFISVFLISLGMGLIGMFPVGMLTIGSAWELVEIGIAAVAGAALYQEGAAATAPSMSAGSEHSEPSI
ncbi:MAG: hypothetical protein P8Y95_00265 [Gammaproteobacteria bacterium]|jgi:hypothetical protein